MKCIKVLLPSLCALFASTAVHAGDNASLTQFDSKVLPVLVQVDAKGHVTSLSPARTLAPAMDRLLRRNMQEMIVEPLVRDGKPVNSQFVANMAVEADATDAGQYSVRFVVASTSPVPSGNWYWVHRDGTQLALQQQGATPIPTMRRLIEPPASPGRGYASPESTPSNRDTAQSRGRKDS